MAPSSRLAFTSPAASSPSTTMQSGVRQGGQPSSVKIYNAVYSSVQVYECMVRGIAVMRRRADSFVNATQILKVAGVDKGRRTKILEKEILPGKHEIVQGGYGKYQGTWIPLERGRELALQYGIAHLVSPLFDFIPSTAVPPAHPNSLASMQAMVRPLSAAATMPATGTPGTSYNGSQLGPVPIMPGSALRLLNQGRAQGLFTPSTSASSGRPAGYYPGPGGNYPTSGVPSPAPSPAPGAAPTLKRTRTDSELITANNQNGNLSASKSFSSANTEPPALLEPSPDIPVVATRPPSAASTVEKEGGDGPSPAKRARTVPPSAFDSVTRVPSSPVPAPSNPRPLTNGTTHKADEPSQPTNGVPPALDPITTVRLATTPLLPPTSDKLAPLKSTHRCAVMAAILREDNPVAVLELIKDVALAERPQNRQPLAPLKVDLDIILDDLGHSPLHIAAGAARMKIVQTLVANAADINRGNYNGETPLVRACLLTPNFERQSFHELLKQLHPSIRTLDTIKQSVLHHIAATAGIKGRASYARYYMEGVLKWIAENEGAHFKNLIDIQDDHGDTALNVAARVGNRSLVRSLIDVGANRILGNKLGLRPGDFGVEIEELGGPPRAEDLLSSLRSGPSIPAQKSQDVIADLTKMITELSSDFATEIKSKQEAFDVTQAHLRAATRELADQRKQIQSWRGRCSELDQVAQRGRNLEKALLDEDGFDWTGRSEVNGEPAHADAGLSFAHKGLQSTMAGLDGSLDISFDLDGEPAIPTTDTLASLIKMRRMNMWQDRIERLLEQRLQTLRGASADKEFQCKKVVALSASVPLDKVDDMLEDLLVAVESEPQVVDIGRVSSFLQKVREGTM